MSRSAELCALFLAACGGISAEDDNFAGRLLDSEGSGLGAVGVAISSDGTEEELSVYGMGWSRFDRTKKLTSIFFVNPNGLRSSETAYTGVAMGATKALGGENYFPLLALTNFSEISAAVAITAANTPDGGLPRTESKHITIPAMSTATIPLESSNPDMFLRNSVLVQSTLPPGAVATKLISFGAEGNSPIVEYQPKDTQQKQNSGLHPWSVAGGQESTLFLFNYTADDQYFNVKLYANGPPWQRALLLKAMETRNLQIDQVIKDQVPDDKGRKLPKDAESGEAEWSTPGRFKGIGRMLVSHPARGLARNFSCGQCLELCSASLDPNSSLTVPVGGSGPLGDGTPGLCIDQDCACSKGVPDSSGGDGFSLTWTSLNTSIATISGSTTSASATFVGAGGGQGGGHLAIFDPSSGCSAATNGPITVQVPTYFFSPSAAQTSAPPACQQPGFNGFFINVSYYVADANQNRISQSGMAPGENIGSGWNDAFATPATTLSDGSFNDTPFGACFETSGHFCDVGSSRSFRLTNNGTIFSIATSSTIPKECTDGIELDIANGQPATLPGAGPGTRIYIFGNTQ